MKYFHYKLAHGYIFKRSFAFTIANFIGIEFTLSADGYSDDVIVTNDDGYAYGTIQYAIGTNVRVCETNTNSSYLNDSACQFVTITNANNGSETNSTTVQNHVIKGKIQLVKMVMPANPDGSQVERPGANFIFDIYLKSTNELVDTITTDKDGFALSKDLPYGTYTVKERTNEDGLVIVDGKYYNPIDPFDIEVNSNGATITKILSNYPSTTQLKVYKRNGDTNIPVKDMTFELYREDGSLVEMEVNYPEHKVISQFTTASNGYVDLPQKLEWGIYTLKEVKTPDGLLNIPNGEMKISLYQDEIVIDVINDAAKGQITINKTGRVLSSVSNSTTEYGELYSLIYSDTSLANTVWEIYAAKDIKANDINDTLLYSKDELVDTITTGDKAALSKELPLGKYYVKEKTTLNGYILDKNIYDIELKYEGDSV